MTGFHICQSHMDVPDNTTDFGDQFLVKPIYTDVVYPGYQTVYRRTEILYEGANTDGKDSAGDMNKIKFEFQAVLVDLVGFGLYNGANYYLTAGVMYGLDKQVLITR